MSWSELFANKKVEDMWQIFIGKLQAIVTSYVPSKNFLGENIVHGFIAEQENNWKIVTENGKDTRAPRKLAILLNIKKPEMQQLQV